MHDPATTKPASGGLNGAHLARHVRGQLLDCLRHTESLLADRDAPRDQVVHQARKNMKRVRAILRLKADAAAVDTADQQFRCRRIGQRLGALRDADVMLLTLRKVVLDAGERLPSDGIAGLERTLAGRRDELLTAGAFADRTLRDLRSELQAVIDAVEARPLPTMSEIILTDAVQRSRRRGERAYRKLGPRADDEALHRLRKRAKQELYQRSLLDGIVAIDASRQSGLDVLSDALGWHQDLVVLRSAAASCQTLSAELDEQLRRQRRNCRRRARRLAATLYG